MDRLTFAVLSDSLAEIRRVTARCGRDDRITAELLQLHFSVWERGVLLNAACFLLDFPEVAIEIPARAFSIARRVVAVEYANGFTEDLLAAAVSGGPWRSYFPSECLHCTRSATWRQIILPSEDAPPETAWRYDRPENHAPLCRRCIVRLAYRQTGARIELVRALWGARFEAFFRWHQAFTQRTLPPDWDRGINPLWPAEFGGQTWAAGSGSLDCADPRMHYGVLRSTRHKSALDSYLGPVRAAEITRPNFPPDFDLLFPPLEIGAGKSVGALS